MELQVFNNEEFGDVRTLTIDSEPWFVGKDVAEILGYSKARNAISAHVDDDDKKDAPIQGDLGGVQNMTIINESGLYSLILSSKLPGAKRFKHWVTSEVLPAIRKHGMYAIDEIISNPDLAIKALTELKAERERSKALSAQVEEMKPKASYCELILNCKDLVAISEIAKDYGWSAAKMNKYLHEKGIQYKQGEMWKLYQKYAEKGYAASKTHCYNGSDGDIHSKLHTYWTQDGRMFIYDLLKADGIIPIVER